MRQNDTEIDNSSFVVPSLSLSAVSAGFAFFCCNVYARNGSVRNIAVPGNVQLTSYSSL